MDGILINLITTLITSGLELVCIISAFGVKEKALEIVAKETDVVDEEYCSIKLHR